VDRLKIDEAVLGVRFDPILARPSARLPQSLCGRAIPHSSIDCPHINGNLQTPQLTLPLYAYPNKYSNSNMTSSPAAEEPTFTPFTKAERIQQLNEIDRSITTLLHSAGLALQTLTSSSSSQDQNKREAFQEKSNAYLRTLQSVDVRLRRQIYGLEEEDIIPAEKGKMKSNEGQDGILGGVGSSMANQGAAGKEETQISVGDGGMGKLEIGWLNSRSGRVGMAMEAELWEKAKGFLEGIEKTAEGGTHEREEDYDMHS
jgi:hypothetical protein